MSDQTSFGALLKRYRQAAGLSQEGLAARAGLSARAISDLERGIYRTPRYDTVHLLLEALTLPEPQQALLRGAARPADVPVSADPLPGATVSAPPLPPTLLIGRVAERSRVLAFLQASDARLVTITGAGGVGKTRLALEIAHDFARDFPDGVVYVPLAPLRASALVPEVIAQRLRLAESVDTPRLEQIRDFLRPRPFLLVLDNFEHLLEAEAFVADLLATCPLLRVLVTSRAPLRLRAEQVVPLAPLPLEEAVALFRDRASSLRPDGRYEDAAVAAICERVDRLPLAIELAAAHVGALTLADLLDRLAIRLPLLRGGARDLPARQQTMRDAIAWSYELLTAAQRQCFRALSVFVGGWTVEAAGAVCWPEGETSADDPFLTLAALVDASLVQVELPAEGSARFRMLEVLREYALERLRAAGEEEACRRRHARYYALLAERIAPFGPGPGAGATQLVQEFPNGRAALQWAEDRQDSELGLWLAGAFGRFWLSHGYLREAEEWMERMLVLNWQAGSPETLSEWRAQALYSLGDVLLSQGKVERAEAVAKEALDRTRQRGNDSATRMAAFSVLALVARRRGRLAEAVAYFIESENHTRLAEATAAVMTSESPARLTIRDSVKGTALLNRAELAELQGDLALATTLTEEGRATAKAAGVPFVVAGMTTRLGHLARRQGNLEPAKSHYREALVLFRAFGSPTFTAWCLEGLAAVLSAQGYHAQATRLCAAAAALREGAQTPLPPEERAAFEQVVSVSKANLGEAAFAAHWAAGAALTQDELLTYALSA